MPTTNTPALYSGDEMPANTSFSVSAGSMDRDVGPASVSNGVYVYSSQAHNRTLGHPQASVQLYTVIVCSVAMFAFGVLGLLSNMALLLCTKCKKSIRHIQYGLPYCLATINVIFCLLWVPLEILRVIFNYFNQGLYAILCHADVALFYFCIGTLVFINVFIAIHRILQFLSIRLMQTAYILAGIKVSIILGFISGVGVSLDYEHTLDYRICTQVWPATAWRLSIAAIAVNTVWMLLLIIISSSLLVTMTLQRQKLDNKPKKRQENSSKGYSCQKASDDLEEARQRFLDSIPEGLIQNNQNAQPTAKNISIDGSTKKLTFANSKKEGTDTENSDDDDDFDQRMKIKLQKSLSGRRHTVANIGLGEPSYGGRRGSMEAVKEQSTNPYGYNYVRKWSVDIIALQDQLENPKAFITGAASASGALTTLTDKSLVTNRSTSSTKITGSISEEKPEERPEQTSQTSKLDDDDDDHKESFGEDQKAQPVARPNDDGVANGNPGDHMSVLETSVIDNQEDECEPIFDKKEIVQALQINTVCFVLLLTVFSCLLPFSLLQFLQVSMEPSLNRNLTVVLVGLCVIQTPIHTFLLAWMEKKLWHGLRRLRVKLTHWRCVCYCNIGKGRKCFSGPPAEPNPTC